VRNWLSRIGSWFRESKAGLITVPWSKAFRHGLPFPGTSGWNAAGASMQVSAVSASVRLISGTVAKLPLAVFQMNGEERTRNRKHWLETLLKRPNAWQTGFEFRRQLTAHATLYGNGYALIRREMGRIVALIPFEDPTKMKVDRDDFEQPPTYYYSDKSGVRTYTREEILHLRDLSFDGVAGLSRLDEAARSVGLALSAEQFATSFFENGAEPGIGVSFQRNLTPEQRKDFVEAWKESHQGPNRAHAPFVMEGGAALTQLGATNKDSQMLELRSFQIEDIASRRFGAPAHLVGQTEKQTSWGTGVEQMALGFLKFHLLDWLEMWETSVKRDLLDQPFESGTFVEHNVDGLLRGDFKTRMEGYQVAIQNGILSPDEVRKKENMPPRADGLGGKFWMPSNMTVAGQSPAAPSEPQPMPGLRPRNAWRTKTRAAIRAISGKSEDAA